MKPRLAHVAPIVALVLALAVVPGALATGGRGKPSGGSGQTVTGVVNVSAGTYTVTGHGFKSGEAISLAIAEAGGCCSASQIWADSSGSFTTTRQLVGPGPYTVYASVYSSRRWHVVAQWSFSV
jgi:hypothetical protein